MAIKSFSSGSLEAPTMNVYSLSNFNGVDYTTTPTLVDDTRGIDMSNYLPISNSLAKRNGWEVLNKFKWEGETLHIYNIWKFKNYYDANNETNTNYIIFAGLGTDDIKKVALYSVNTLIENHEGYSIQKIYPTEDKMSSEFYSYGVIFENRLFILAMNKYLMLYYDKDEQNVYTLKIEEVKNQAFIPQVIVGLGHKDSQDVASKVNDFNLLKDECYIELLNYPQTDEEQILKYDIGQFFTDKMTDLTLLKIDNDDYFDDIDFTKEDETYVGKINFDKETKILTITKNAREDDLEQLENATYINLHFSYVSNNAQIVENMRFGIPYGSSGFRDRLFLSGNPEFPNLDIHCNDTGLEEDNWKDYTYFGDMSYRNFGTDAQKITGYGILNNGYMAIFKETSSSLEPNLYIRRSEITSDNEGNYIEKFPVTLSGVSVGSDVIGQVINYGNDLLINAPKGIYKINVSDSTATQTYEALEMSYYIRDNLSKDLSDSCSIIFEGKLYVSRKDYKGLSRVYVADQDRYSYIDNVRVYEWWVLDDVFATKFYIFDNELYFTDKEKGLCKFNNTFLDSYRIEISDVNINGNRISSDVSYNKEDGIFVVSPTSDIFKVVDKYEDKKEGFDNFKTTTKISFGNDISVNINFRDFYIQNNTLKINFNNDENDNFLLQNLSTTANKIKIYKNGKIQAYNLTGIYSYQIINGRTYQLFELIKKGEVDNATDIDNAIIVTIDSGTQFEINEMYTNDSNNYKLSECFITDNIWYRQYEDDLGNKNIQTLGSTAVTIFNKFDLFLFGSKLNIIIDEENFILKDLKFYVSKPVSCYWQSKYHSLGKLDYLKTIYSITFVPETKLGGVTNIGYRTAKSEISYQTSAEEQDFTFEYVDFNDFTFGGSNMAKTYTSKKKIKNFSFIQLKFISNDIKNSTIVSLWLRYKYSRINKGVK